MNRSQQEFSALSFPQVYPDTATADCDLLSRGENMPVREAEKKLATIIPPAPTAAEDHFELDRFVMEALAMESAINLNIQYAATMMNVYEPVRRVTHWAPPKRFYRSIWASMSRRVLAVFDP